MVFFIIRAPFNGVFYNPRTIYTLLALCSLAPVGDAAPGQVAVFSEAARALAAADAVPFALLQARPLRTLVRIQILRSPFNGVLYNARTI